MKNKIAFFILCLVFVSSSFYRPPIVSTACQRITQTSGTVTYYTTAADIWLLFDNSSTIATITVPFPDNPVDGQSFGISARSDITALTLSTSSIPISGSITTLSGGNCVRWVYNQDGNRWFNYLKPTTWGVITGAVSNQTDIQGAFDTKLASNGNGSSLTGLTASQVGLANVNNTSDVNKPVSSATQTALNAKLATNGDGSSLINLSKSQVGLSAVDNTSDVNKPVSTATQTALNDKLSTTGSAASLTSVPVNQATGVLPFANGGRAGSASTSATTGTMTVSMANSVITVTPTGACTFNASGGVVGQITTFIITTSGTTSFTLTWGTNYRKTGTLATGTTSARFFAVSFVCVNGTIWQEISRTAVQT